ncbi:hypothetical protein [Nostoc sp.]|uniref:hypothetical protein n=1 Tax=Nostoc sp. TaxID=1180 RepID=UPI002FF60020
MPNDRQPYSPISRSVAGLAAEHVAFIHDKCINLQLYSPISRSDRRVSSESKKAIALRVKIAIAYNK